MPTLPLKSYSGLLVLSAPLLRHILRRRLARGKEMADRLGERRGEATKKRPEGKLVWLHGASVGEALSALLVVERVLARDKDVHIMVTTGTVTSAKILAERLPARAFHQFIPLDHPLWVRRFFDHWQPDIVLWMESEIWPHLLLETKKRKIPAALLNARISPKSLKTWQKFPKTIAEIMSVFGVCHAQADYELEHLEALGARNIAALGNLKYAAAVPSCDEKELLALQGTFKNRPIIFYASTHKGEEILAAETHKKLQKDFPNLLTLIAPRHPERGAEICAELMAAGHNCSQRSDGKKPSSEMPIYICDTLGEYGLFYRLADIAIIGGSFVPHGGQSPVEAAQLSCPILYGDNMFNFVEICGQLEKAEGACHIKDKADLSAKIAYYLGDKEASRKMANNAKSVAAENAQSIDRVMAHIAPLLEEAGI